MRARHVYVHTGALGTCRPAHVAAAAAGAVRVAIEFGHWHGRLRMRKWLRISIRSASACQLRPSMTAKQRNSPAC